MGITPSLFYMKKEIREIELAISRLLHDIDKLRRDPTRKLEYREKLKQLMYWRRRRNQMGANHDRDTDNNQIEKEEGHNSSVRKSCHRDSQDSEFEENPF
jgi:hypothetical protein